MPNGPEELAEQHKAILAGINALSGKLEAMEWRRKCAWLLTGLKSTIKKLQEQFPAWEWNQVFSEIVEPLDCYANLTFESAQDLRTVLTCLGLVYEVFEEVGKSEEPSSSDIWRETRPLIDDLATLDSGDPPSSSVAQRLIRSLKPELQDSERAAVRERFDERSRENIKRRFVR